MRRLVLFALGVLAAGVGPARAYDFEAIAPLDVTSVDRSMLDDIYGAWEIRDRAGKRRCRITLGREPTIGGYAIEIDPACPKAFPIMGDIGAWRLLEGWAIDLVDPLRKTRVRLYTPDDRYIAIGEDRDVARMDTIVKLPTKAPAIKTPAAKTPARK